jgi:hypothetical protein
VTPDALRASLESLKKRHPGPAALSNYFRQSLERATQLRMLEGDKSVCFLHDEWDFGRLYLCTYDVDDLTRLLGSAQWPPIVACDWVSKNADTVIERALTNAGFHLHGVYDRIVCHDFKRESTNANLAMATPADTERIHWLLLQVFDKYADHIMPLDELQKCINLGQAIVSRDADAVITGFVVFPITGHTCNFNFLYNVGGTANLFHLLGNFYGLLNERGVRSGFSWVRRTRPAVLNLHRSFRWKPDGLTDHIYLRS